MRNKIQQETKFEYTDEVITWHNYLKVHVLVKTFPSIKPAQWSLCKLLRSMHLLPKSFSTTEPVHSSLWKLLTIKIRIKIAENCRCSIKFYKKSILKNLKCLLLLKCSDNYLSKTLRIKFLLCIVWFLQTFENLMFSKILKTLKIADVRCDFTKNL